MAFSSPAFLFYLLPVVLLVCAFGRRVSSGLRNVAILTISVLFYFWGSPLFLPVLLGMMVTNYTAGRAIATATAGRARQLLWFAVALNLGLLVYFKYWHFFVTQLVFGSYVPFKGLPPPSAIGDVILPLGLSFFTFQAISYLVDVSQRRTAPAQTIFEYARYALFFPTVTAGPISRYVEVSSDLTSTLGSSDQFERGLFRFAVGLAKKVLIADVVGHTADQVFGLSHSQLGTGEAWLGLVAYSAQIYFDFSGYSDMAIGLALMCGVRLPENFNNPYLATSFSDFWRRWHMTFGRWMKDYLYFPLGGNRCSVARQYLNLWIVFLLSGLWHGAEWTFIAWGAFHGIFMTVEKCTPEKLQRMFVHAVPVFARMLLTLMLVMLSRVLFRSESLSQSVFFYQQLFWPAEGFPIEDRRLALGLITSPYELCMIVLAYVLCFVPLLSKGTWFRERVIVRLETWVLPQLARTAGTALLLLLSYAALFGRDFAPFIYARF